MERLTAAREQPMRRPIEVIQTPNETSECSFKVGISGKLRKSLAVIGSSAVIAAGVGGVDSTEIASAESPSEASCRKKAQARPNDIKVNNYQGQIGRYLMSWTAPDIKECSSKGIRRIRFGFDVKPKPSDDYIPSIFFKELTNNKIDLSRGQLFNQVVRCGRGIYDKKTVMTRPTFHSTWKSKKGDTATKTHYVKAFNGCKRR